METSEINLLIVARQQTRVNLDISLLQKTREHHIKPCFFQGRRVTDTTGSHGSGDTWYGGPTHQKWGFIGTHTHLNTAKRASELLG